MRALRVLAAVALVLLALGLILHLGGVTIGEQLLTAALDRQGLGPSRLRVAGIGLDGIHLADVRLGATGAIGAARVDVGLSIAGLRNRRADRVAITGLRLDLAADGAGRISVTDLPTPSTAPTGLPAPAPGALPVLPVDELVLDDAHLRLTTPYGAGDVRASGSVTPTAAGLSAQLRLSGSLGATQIEAGTASLIAASADAWVLQLADVAVSSADLGLAATGLRADVDWHGDRAALTAAVGSLDDHAKPARFAPLTAELHAERQGDRIGFGLTGGDRKGAAHLTVTGSAILANATATATVALAVRPFLPGKLQPRDLLPALGAGLPPVAGTVGAAGTIGWAHGTLTPDLVVSLADIGVTSGAARLADGRGALRLDGLRPPTTPPGQRLIATLSAPGLPPAPATLAFQLRRDGGVAVESLEVGVADGRLSTGGLVLMPGRPLPADLAMPVKLENVDLKPLLELIGVGGLSGSGRLDGDLPLALAGGKLVLHGGRVTGRGPGVLRYEGAALPADAGGGEQVALLREVLKDFHYESLGLDLDRGADGAGGVVLHLKGSNPAVLEGRPFVLNIRLDANFDQLAALLLAGLDAATGIARGAIAKP